MEITHFFPLKTSADHIEHALKVEGKKKYFFLPSNHVFIHEKHYFWQQRLNKDFQVLSHPTRNLRIAFQTTENLLNACIPGFCEKHPSAPKASQLSDVSHFLYIGPQIKNS